ncbi:MAG: TIGR03546 family protein [Planctomycetota bacterium]
MILWSIKLFSNLRKAIAGRRYPSQLAWAVAFGFLLGVVPHGNLLAIALLIVVLSLKLNHAMAGFAAVLTAIFAAPRLDPITHLIGQTLHSHPKIAEYGVASWQLPLMPWTDLNNTIVLGSLVLGVAALIPIFVATYPIFRVFKPREEAEPIIAVVSDVGEQPAAPVVGDKGVRTHGSHGSVPAPHQPASLPTKAKSSGRPSDVRNVAGMGAETYVRADGGHSNDPTPTRVETRIDVIRVSEKDSASKSGSVPQHTNKDMDEALNYLLRQLRDSQQKDAA